MSIVDFIKAFPVRYFHKGEILLDPGQQATTILLVREGIIKVSSLSDNGVERLLWLAGRYDIIPSESFFNTNAPARYFYTAFCEGSAYAVDKKEFLDIASRDATTMYQVGRGLSEHYDDLLNRLNSLEQSNLRRKILYMLQTLCEKFSAADVVQLHELGLNLTHQDIADMVHATREAVSIDLKQLRAEGFLDYTRTTFTVYYEKIKKENMASA